MQTLLATLVMTILATSVFAWLVALARWRAGRSLLAANWRPPIAWDFLDVLAGFALQMGNQILAMSLGRYLLGLGSTPLDELPVRERAWMYLLLALGALLGLLMLAAFLLVRHAVSHRQLGFDLSCFGPDVWLGCVAFVMIAPPVYGVQLVLVRWFESHHPLLDLLREDPQPQFFLVSGVAAVLVAPLVEEFLFRGLLQAWLERWLHGADPQPDLSYAGADSPAASSSASSDPPAAAEPEPVADAGPAPADIPQLSGAVLMDRPLRPAPILLSGAIFALLHLSHGPDWVPLLVLAWGLGYLYQRTGRLLPCIVVHALLNGVTVLGMAVEVFGG